MTLDMKSFFIVLYFALIVAGLFLSFRFFDRKFKAYHDRTARKAEDALIKLQAKLLEELKAHNEYLENILASHNITGYNRFTFRPDTMRLLKRFIPPSD